MSKSHGLVWKIGISVAAIALAILRIMDPIGSVKWLDTTFLLLIMVLPLAFLIPWHRLKAFKAAGIEVILESPLVRGAIDGIEMSGAENRSIRRTLYRLSEEIDNSVGSRVLWIDDQPEEVLGERRILRALGLNIIFANDTASARDILKKDNDFDLVISDMQRKSEPDSEFNRYGGIEFIMELRQWNTKPDEPEDPVTKNIPVVIYTAYEDDVIPEILQDVSATDLKDIHFCHSIEGLLKGVFEILPAARAEIIKVRSKKKATDIR